MAPTGVRCILALVLWFSLVQLHSSAPLDIARPLLIPAGDGSYGGLEDTFYAASVLSAAKDPALDAPKTCSWVGKAKPDAALLLSASAFARLSALVCSSAPAGLKEVEGALLSASKSATSAKDASLALQGLAAITAKGWNTAPAAQVQASVKAALRLLEVLRHSGGSWKSSKGASEPSALSAGYALKALAALLRLDGTSRDKVLELAGNLRSLFYTGITGPSKEVYFDGKPEEGGPLPATALIASAYISLASALDSPLEVPKDSVAGLGLYLATAGAPLTLLEAHLLFEALGSLDANSFAVPLVLSVPGHYSLSSAAPLSVSLSTPLGRPVTAASVTLSSAKLGIKPSKTVASAKVLAPEGGSYPLPAGVLSASSALGIYTLKLEVADLESPLVAVSPVSQTVVATARIAVSAVSVAVADSDSGPPESEITADLGSSHLQSLSASHLQKLRVSVTLSGPGGKGFIPQQAFLTLTHESGVAHHFLLKPAADASGRLSLKLNLLESLEKLYYQSGVYSLSLTLGDLYMENSGSWALGAIDLDLPEAPDGAPKPPPSPKSLAERFGPRDEISHIFRKPEKRPAPVVSYVFTALTLLPLLLLISGLAALGVNLKLLPTAGLPLLAAVGFHGGIAAILLLYVAFWVQVKLFTTLKVLVLLALITAVPGHYILSFLADSTVKTKTS